MFKNKLLLFFCIAISNIGLFTTVKASINNVKNLNAVDYYGMTPLMSAIYFSHSYPKIISLIDNGADVNYLSKDRDETALMLAAAMCNTLPVMDILIAKGADVNAVNSQGDSALHKACRASFIDSVKFLVDRGAKINITNLQGETPLQKAKEKQNRLIIDFLISKGAR